MYSDPEEKKNLYDEEIKDVDFLKNGHYKIMGPLITKYDLE